MVKIDIISDLHVDKWSPEAVLDYAEHKQSKILIVAGDISDDMNDVRTELARMAACYETVLYVEGNNEIKRNFYGAKTYSTQGSENQIRDIIAQGPSNVHYLKDGVFIKDDVAIIGRNGHWDYKIAPFVSEQTGMKALAEMRGVGIKDVEDFKRQAIEDAQELTEIVAELSADSSIAHIVVVTHTVPDSRLIKYNFDKVKREMFATAGNSRMTDVIKADKDSKIKLWVFGHEHSPQDKRIDHVRYFANPRGTEKDATTNDYRPRTVVIGKAKKRMGLSLDAVFQFRNKGPL